MKEDNVNISLAHYNRLVNAEELAQNKANEDIKYQVDKKIVDMMKHTILVKKEHLGFGLWTYITEIITNDDAFQLRIEKMQEDYLKKIRECEEKEKEFICAVERMENVKWYDLLFGIKNANQ